MAESISGSPCKMSGWVQRNQQVAMALVLALGLIIATFIGANALWRIKRLSQSSLNVTGYAVQQVNSDKVAWELTVTSQGTTREAAYATLTADYNKLRSFLLANGMTPAEVSEGSINVNPFYERVPGGGTSNVIAGFDMSKSIKVTSIKVPTVTRLTHQVETLLQQGLSFTVQSPQYLYTKLESKKLEMLAKAMENAKARANRMARASDDRIGPMLSASSGVFQITPVDSTEVSDWGLNDTTTVQKDIRAVVNATFMVE